MSTRYPSLTRSLLSVAIAYLGMTAPVIKAESVAAKRASAQTEREKVAALREAKRLGLQAEQADKQGKIEESERLAQRALVLEEKVRGPAHIEVANRLDHIADLYVAHQKERDAEPLYERARAIREEALSKHPDVYERDGRSVRIRTNQPAEKATDAAQARKKR